MKRFSILKVLLSFLIFIVVITLSIQLDTQIDLTPDKRYTLNPIAKQMVRNQNEPVVITVLLEGNIPASFRNYKSYLEYYLSELRRYSNNVEVVYKNPSDGTQEEQEGFKKFLSKRGISPISRQVSTGDEVSKNLLYPYISIHNDRSIVFVNLLESQSVKGGEEEKLLESQLAFESKFLRALKQVFRSRLPEVHVIGASARLISEGYKRDESLSGFRFVPSKPDIVLSSLDSIDAIVSVLNKEALTREELLAIDVAAGAGVPVLWMIDKSSMTLDSLRATGSHLAEIVEYQAEDYLFRCGVRIQPELIMDLSSSLIPQVVNDGSSTSVTKMMNYPFHPLILSGKESQPSSRLSGPLAMYFASPIELLEYPKSVIKRSLLTTSPYTKTITLPRMLDFGFMQIAPRPEEYQQGPLSVVVQIEGRVKPYFTNRLTSDDRSLLDRYKLKYDLDSQYIKQIIVSDADFATPSSDTRGFYPAGYNTSEGQMYYANTQLVAQLLESVIDGDDLLKIAQKTSTLTVLDEQKFKITETFYYLILLVLPLVVLLLSYFLYHLVRRKRYAA